MKKVKRFLIGLLAVILCCPLISVKNVSAATLSLSQLQEKFPNGAYWNHVVQSGHNYVNYQDVGPCNNPDGYTWSPCDSHSANVGIGGYDCNSFQNSMQCAGFAKKLAYDAYGSYCTSWSTVGINNIKPGDVVHYRGGDADATWGHWVFVIGVNGSTITVGECNFANAPCQIRWGRTLNLENVASATVYSAPYALNGGGTSPEPSPAYQLSTWTVNISETDGRFGGTVETASVVRMTEAGGILWDSNGNKLAEKSEFSNANQAYPIVYYDIQSELGVTLSPGTTYYFQVWAKIGGTIYYSDKASFTTLGVAGHNPEGALETLIGGTESITLGGWAFDRDNLSTQLRLDIYVGGDAGSGHCYQIYADDERTDINSAYPGVGNYHGFYDTVSVSETGTQSVYVYAINVGAGNNILLGSGSVTISPASDLVTSVSLEKSSVNMLVGESVRNQVTVLPESAPDKTVNWWSDNTDVAEVNNGMITAIAPGTTTISVMSLNGKKATCTVNVLEGPQGISLAETNKTLNAGESFTNSVTILPEDIVGTVDLTWSSSDESVATVDEKGEITAVDLGNAIITAEATNGKKAECVVRVNITGACGDNITYTLSSEGDMNITGTGEINRFPWSASGADYRDKIINVTVNEGITAIGAYAFLGCKALESVVLPSHMDYLGQKSFSECENLRSIVMPTVLNEMDMAIFKNCYLLENITLPESLKTIPQYAFENCKSLETVELNENITAIGNYAFNGCDSLKSIYIYAPVCCFQDWGLSEWGSVNVTGNEEILPNYTVIYGYSGSTAHSYAEQYNRKFVSMGTKTSVLSGTCGPDVRWTLGVDGQLTISGTGEMYSFSSNRNENSAPWDNYASMIKTVKVNEGVTNIGNAAFIYCTSLTDIDIAESVKTIGRASFTFCTSLEQITLPDGLTSIEYRAFSYANSLKEIFIPESVTYIGDGAFYNCKGLEKATIANAECVIYASSDTFLNGVKYDASNAEWIIYRDTVICGFRESTAQDYAEKYGYVFEELENEVKGDIDGDGTVTIFDAGLIIDMVYGRTEPDVSLADLDGDGTVTIFDAGAAIDLVYGR